MILRNAVRRLMLGFALATVLAAVPVRPAAAEPGEGPVRVVDLWQAAWEWVVELWEGTVPAGTSGTGGGTNAAGTCRGDEGLCIDPNG